MAGQDVEGVVVSGLDGLRGRIERRTRRAAVPEDHRVRLDLAAGRLDDEFREFDVTTCRARGGYALAAQRHRGDGRPGLYAVVTDDPDEMRAALEEDSPSGAGGNAVVPDGG